MPESIGDPRKEDLQVFSICPKSIQRVAEDIKGGGLNTIPAKRIEFDAIFNATQDDKEEVPLILTDDMAHPDNIKDNFSLNNESNSAPYDINHLKTEDFKEEMFNIENFESFLLNLNSMAKGVSGDGMTFSKVVHDALESNNITTKDFADIVAEIAHQDGGNFKCITEQICLGNIDVSEKSAFGRAMSYTKNKIFEESRNKERGVVENIIYILKAKLDCNFGYTEREIDEYIEWLEEQILSIANSKSPYLKKISLQNKND